jgi:transposase-like protein
MMKKIPKREYTVELKEQAVKRVKDGKSVGVVAKDVCCPACQCQRLPSSTDAHVEK